MINVTFILTGRAFESRLTLIGLRDSDGCSETLIVIGPRLVTPPGTARTDEDVPA